MTASRLLGQNIYAYDLPVLRKHGLNPSIPIDDTLYLHHTLAPEEPHKLEYLGSLFTSLPYWKDEGKAGEDVDYDPETLWKYNATDCIATGYVWDKLMELSNDPKYLGFDVSRSYSQKIELARLAHEMTWKGLLIDKTQLEYHRARLTLLRNEALANVRNYTDNREFNPNSSGQVRRLLYDTLKLPVLKRSKKTNLPSTDIETLQWLTTFVSTQQQALILKVLKSFRKYDKLLGTYVEGLNVHDDGCVHPIWKAALTETNRWRSSDPNAQNWPVVMRTMVVARPNHVFIKYDAEQLELRIQTYLSHCKFLTTALATNDPHELATLALFYGADIFNEASLKAAREKYYSESKRSQKRKRTLAKNFEYGSGYGGGVKVLVSTIRKKFPRVKEHEIEQIFNLWKKLTPEIAQFTFTLIHQYNETGYLDGLLGYVRRFFPGGAKPTEIANSPMQVTSAELVNARMLMTCHEVGNYFVTNEHDGLMQEVPEDMAEDIQMDTKAILERPIWIDGKLVSLPFKTEISDRWEDIRPEKEDDEDDE